MNIDNYIHFYSMVHNVCSLRIYGDFPAVHQGATFCRCDKSGPSWVPVQSLRKFGTKKHIFLERPKKNCCM